MVLIKSPGNTERVELHNLNPFFFSARHHLVCSKFGPSITAKKRGGRYVQFLLIGDYVIGYWPDDAVKEFRIIEIDES